MFGFRAATGMLLLATASPGLALAFSTNVAFNQVNQNPWGTGSAYVNSWVNDDIKADFNLTIPTTGVSPSSILADFFGLPEIGFARLGASTSGFVGLDLGYHVNGGRMNISFPGRGTIDFQTYGAGQTFLSGSNVHTSTAFDAGLTRLFVPDVPLSVLGGGGYDPGASIAGFPIDRYFQPTFQTYFPNASAWATLNYDVQAGVTASVGVARVLGECVLCYSRTAALRSAETIDLVNVDKNGVSVLGVGAVDFDTSIGVPGGSVQVSYPDVSVTGALQADQRTLSGAAAKPIIALDAALEQLVPFVGALLRQQIGPFEIQLLSANGGPILGLYQDFTVKVVPQVTLKFSQVVGWVEDGVTRYVSEITGDLGDDFDWFPLLGRDTSTLTVQTVFTPRATITNETGFSLGYNLDVDALGVGTPFGSLGPLDVVTLNDPGAIRLPAFFSHSFDVQLPRIALAPTTFDVVSGVLASELAAPFTVSGLLDQGDGSFRLDVLLAGSSDMYSAFANGSILTIDSFLGDGTQQLFVADSDVILEIPDLSSAVTRFFYINLGRQFCFGCEDLSSLFDAASPFFEDDGERLYIPDLSVFRTDEVDAAADPMLNRTITRTVHAAESTIGEIVPIAELPPAVPEPASWLMMIAGLGLVGGTMRRRPRPPGRRFA